MSDKDSTLPTQKIKRVIGQGVEADTERFWRRVHKTPTCWLWTGHVASVGGRGCTRWGSSRCSSAVRVSLMLAGRPPEDDEFVKQTCGNLLCVNPDHLHVPTFEERFWARVEKGDGDGCWLWRGGVYIGGYGEAQMPSGKYGTAHRVSWILAHGDISDGLVVCHNCDARYPPGDISYRLCVRPDHLFLGTHLENIQDCVKKRRTCWGERHGLRKNPERAPRGTRNGHAKLTDDIVREMRRLYATGEFKLSELGARYGVSPGTMTRVINGSGWRHVTD